MVVGGRTRVGEQVVRNELARHRSGRPGARRGRLSSFSEFQFDYKSRVKGFKQTVKHAYSARLFVRV